MIVGVRGVVDIACALEAALVRITVATATEQAVLSVAGRFLRLHLTKMT